MSSVNTKEIDFTGAVNKSDIKRTRAAAALIVDRAQLR
jgi:hypothetical protein